MKHISDLQQPQSTPGAVPKSFYVLLAATFIDLFGIGVLQPVLPFLVTKYTHTHLAFWVGIITALFAFCEFVAAPTLGLLSDRYGRRPILLLSMAGSTLRRTNKEQNVMA